MSQQHERILDRSSKTCRWQFSLRTLLLVVAVVSAVLAIAARAPEIIIFSTVFALSVLVLIEGPWELLRLLVSERHPRWSAAAWAALGTLLLAAAAALGWKLVFGQPSSAGWKLCLSAMLNCVLALCCYRTAVRTFRRTPPQDFASTGR